MRFTVFVTSVDRGTELDLVVEVADATITVRQLGTELGLGDNISIDGKPVDPNLPVSASGLVSGARVSRSVVLPAEPNIAAPVVTLHQVGGLAAGGGVDLPPGRHAIGSTGPARSELREGNVSAPRFSLDVSPAGEVTLFASSADQVVVDGVQVSDKRALQTDNIIDLGTALFRVLPYRTRRRRFGNAAGRIEVSTARALTDSAPPEYVTPPDVESMRRRERTALQQSSHPVHATFRADLAKAHRTATGRARGQHADTATLRHAAAVADSDLWTTRPDVPIHLGYGDVPWNEALKPGSRSPEEFANVMSRFSRLPSVPLTVDLNDTGQLALAGPRHAVLSVARWIIMQSASRTDPASLSISVASVATGLWEWTKWLPHCGVTASTTELIIADGAAITAPPLGGTRLVVRLLTEAEASTWAGEIAMVDGDGHLHVSDIDGLATGLSESSALAWARTLAPLTTSAPVAAEPPALLLDEMCGLATADSRSDDVVTRWRTTVNAGTALVPFGAEVDGLVAVDLATCPHVVVSGPSGSGRSTALGTLLLSLALNHPPDMVEVIVIDAASEGTFRALGDLPHIRTSIVGLDDPRTEELLDRLARNGATPGIRITSRRTVIFVDDATTLAAAVPGAAAALAKIGHHSPGGPHLILATRRPEGLFAAGLLPSGAAHLVFGSGTTVGMGEAAAVPTRAGQARWAVPGEPSRLVHVATVAPADATQRKLIAIQPFISPKHLPAHSLAAKGDPTPLIAAVREASRARP